MSLSKANIDKLGVQIRIEKYSLLDDTLSKLQEHRTSHQDSLSLIFTILCSYVRKVHPTSIVTYRIKRFESIIGKLIRFPEMRFSRMWDIGGCRFIVRNNEDVYKVKKLIHYDNRITIVKEYDYIENPQENGYKALHLFIKCNESDKIIELQIKNLRDHNWATLVEITDVLYDAKIKELGDNLELVRFHYLLSKYSQLSITEKKEIGKIIKNFKYVERLSEVFSRNYINVRQQWYNIENQKNHKYFIIETRKENPPKIYSYKTGVLAEKDYLKLYKTQHNSNIVLTHLPNPSYSQISIAYSNYILTFHSFLDECYEIIESLIFESLEKEEYFRYFQIFNQYNSLLYEHIRNLNTEILEYNQNTDFTMRKSGSKNKALEWRNDIQKQINKSIERNKRLIIKFRKSKPKSFINELIFTQITKFIVRKHKKRVKKI